MLRTFLAFSGDDNWPGRVKYTLNALGHTNQVNYYCAMTGRLLTNEIVDGPRTVYFYDNAGQVTNTLFADGSSTIGIYDGTRLVQSVSRTGLTNSFGFDLAGRQISVTNSLGSVTAYGHDPVGNVTGMTARANSAEPLTTLFEHDSMNRVIRTILPDGRVTTNEYSDLGQLASRTGVGSVPVSYEYEPGGRMTKLIDGQTNETEFIYDCCNLSRKEYADGSGYDYAYTAQNWLDIRVDPKSAITVYGYNNAGQVTNLNYATDPDVIYHHDLLGRMTSRVDAAGTWIWTYDGDSYRVLSETLSSATSVLSAVSYSYHPDTYELASVGIDDTHRTFYNWACGRLVQVSNFQFRVSYAYKPNSDLLWKTVYGTGEVVVTRLYDELNRLTNINTLANGSTLNSFAYTLDSTGRRTGRDDADGSRLDWGYDVFDQLTSASRTNGPNGAADAAYQYAWQYDLVGNHLQETRGQLGLTGAFNVLNQITSRDWSGKLDVWGSVETTNAWWTNTVNGEVCAQFDGSNYLGGAELGAGSNAIEIVFWDPAGTNEETRAVFAPPSKPQSFLWDANGNLTNDGYRVYAWTEENRLAAIEMAPESVSNGLPMQRSEFVYDGQGRRIVRTDLLEWNGAAYEVTNQTRYIWDGMAILAELRTDPQGVSTNYNVWGLDLSQTLHGAGNVGGLLCSSRIQGGAVTNWFYTFDGNGNVADVLDETGDVLANYQYTPFGQVFSSSGPAAGANPWRFSTKPYDDMWGLIFYEYRVYSPDLQIWLSRDPVEEEGGVDLYGFVGNSPWQNWDFLGLCCKVKSFSIKVVGWRGSWPSMFRSRYTKRLYVKFTAEIDKCCDKKDCRIRQDVLGQNSLRGIIQDDFANWTADRPLNWWDGSRWNAGRGRWTNNDKIAEFEDEPGCNGLQLRDFPVKWTGPGGSGHFQFRTKIYDWSKPGSLEDKLEKSIDWGLLIDYSNPNSGRHYFYL